VGVQCDKLASIELSYNTCDQGVANNFSTGVCNIQDIFRHHSSTEQQSTADGLILPQNVLIGFIKKISQATLVVAGCPDPSPTSPFLPTARPLHLRRLKCHGETAEKSAKFRAWDKVPDRRSLIVGDALILLRYSVGSPRVDSHCAANQLDAFNRFDTIPAWYRRVTLRHWGIVYILRSACA